MEFTTLGTFDKVSFSKTCPLLTDRKMGMGWHNLWRMSRFSSHSIDVGGNMSAGKA